MSLNTCKLDVSTTLPLVCICSLFSFLCGVGIGANDLSANFAMVVGSGSLDMKSAIVYCAVFELLGAAFMGGKVSRTIRNGIVRPELFTQNRDVVLIGMTCASFAAALWLYLSTVFGLPVSITHTVIGSVLGFAIFTTWSFRDVEARGLTVVVASWVTAPLAACAVTAAMFYYMRRGIFHVKGRSFALAYRALPYCLAASLLVDLMFVAIEQPPIMTRTFAAWVPVWVQFILLLGLMGAFCGLSARYLFPRVSEAAWEASSFVWESDALRTEVVPPSPTAKDWQTSDLMQNASFFHHHHHPPRSGRTGNEGQPLITGAVSEGGLPLTLPRPLMQSPSQELESGALVRANSNVVARAAGPGRARRGSAQDVSAANNASACANTTKRSTSPTPGLKMAASVIMAPVATVSGSHVLRQNKVRLTAVSSHETREGNKRSEALGQVPSLSLSSSRQRHGPGVVPHSAALSAPTATPPTTATQEMTERSAVVAGEHPSEELATATTPELHPTVQQPYVNASNPNNNNGGGGTYHACAANALHRVSYVAPAGPASPVTVGSEDEFGEEDWAMDHPMQPINFQGLYIKPFNPRAEYLFTGLQVVAGSMSSFVHGAVAGANATAAFVILYDAFSNHELGERDLSSTWSVIPAMLGIAIGMCALGTSLMKTVGMELVTVTPARGWCIQVGGTFVTMILTGIGIPVSLSQAQVGAAIGCGVLDARMRGVSWGLVGKIIAGWVVTLVISAVTTGLSMWALAWFLC